MNADLGMAIYLACLLQAEGFDPLSRGNQFPSPNWETAAWLFECVMNELAAESK